MGMEKEQLIQMLQVYKQKYADLMEEAIMYQVAFSKQVQDNKLLQEQVTNLQNQINEMNHE